MRYFVEIHTDSAAFEEPGPEVARILRELAGRVESYTFDNPETVSPVRDINGNYCGRHGYSKGRPE